MKRLLAIVFGILALLPAAALAQSGEQIQSFDVRARLESDRMLTVTETITYDFGANSRHGIYRDIPIRYERNGGVYRLRLTVDRVTMDDHSVPYDTSSGSGNLQIKIGDADEFVRGVHVYAITYHTDRAINFFDGEGELYWNVTGNGWSVPIDAASFTLTGPEAFDVSTARTICFVGAFGSTEQQCATSGAGTQYTARTHATLQPAEGMTVAIRFPAGVIAAPTTADRVWGFVRDNGMLALPVLTFLLMFWLWNHHGRDPKGRGTVVPHYAAPRDLSPAEMISLKDQNVPTRAVTATILDLARRGYLKIDFGEEKGLLTSKNTYTFVQQKQPDATLKPFETEILEGLFADGVRVGLEDLRGTFYKTVATFKSGVMASLKEQKLFEQSPMVVRGMYMGIAVALAVATFWIVAPFATVVTIIALIASAAIVAIMGWFMPRVTKEGAIVLEEVEGLKWFLSVTEKERLAFHNAPELKPTQFHAFLPAAIAFGVEEKWAEQFRGLDIPPPDYASGSVMHHWMAMNFVHDLNHLNAAAVASAYAAPSSAGSGGSGFSGGGSGGGFGGGGGGSW